MKRVFPLSVILAIGLLGCSTNSTVNNIIHKKDSPFNAGMVAGKNNTHKLKDNKIAGQCEVLIHHVMMYKYNKQKIKYSAYLFNNGHEIAKLKFNTYVNFYVAPNSENQFVLKQDTSYLPMYYKFNLKCNSGGYVYVSAGSGPSIYTSGYRAIPFGGGIIRTLTVSREIGIIRMTDKRATELKNDSTLKGNLY